MKWETRDIDVVEWANTGKFSKLHNIVTPLKLLELFFDDVLVDMVLVTPSCTAIDRKQTLVLKLLMKKFGYS